MTAPNLDRFDMICLWAFRVLLLILFFFALVRLVVPEAIRTWEDIHPKAEQHEPKVINRGSP